MRDDVESANRALADAEAATYRAEARAALLQLDRLAYGPLDPQRSVYLVTYQRKELGEVKPERPGCNIGTWHAYPAGKPDTELGPFRLARQAAAALLQWTNDSSEVDGR